MLGPMAPTEGTATAQLKGRNRPSVGFGVNRVKDGYTLGALRVSGGPPATAETDRSALVSPISGAAGGGRRSTSLFDRTRSGQGVLDRLRGQVRSVSPLMAGVGGEAAAPDSGGSGPASAAAIRTVNTSAAATPNVGTDAGGRLTSPVPAAADAAEPAAAPEPATRPEARRLSIFTARQSQLRSGLRRSDNGSRFLLAQSSPRRTQLGYGQQSADNQSLYGGGLSLFGGGISLYG